MKWKVNSQGALMLKLIRNSPNESAIIITDPHNRVLLWSRGAETLLGYKSEEFIGQECLIEYKPVVQRSRNLNDLRYADFDTDSYSYRTHIATKEGKHLSVSITASRMADAEGEPLGHLFILHDITNEVVQEKFRLILVAIAQISSKRQPLKKMLEKCLSAIQNHLEIPMVYLCLNDPAAGFHLHSYSGIRKSGLSLNCSAKAASGGGMSVKCSECCSKRELTCEELSMHHMSNLIKSEIKTDEPLFIVHAPLLSDAGEIGILHFVIPESVKGIYAEENQILGLIASKVSSAILTSRLEEDLQNYANNLERIVEQRTAELREKDAQIIQAGKLATLGEMATGIAHEINQPLGGISLITQGILRAMHKGRLTDDFLKERLNSINDQIERIDKIINHLRVFGRQAPESRTAVQVNKSVRDVFDFIGEQLKKRNISLDMDLDDSITTVLADGNRLEQVLLNIIGNARDAMDEHEIRVCELLDGDSPPLWALNWEKRLFIRTYRDLDKVVIAIGDTGGGIPGEIRDKIFDPFFTTKEVGKGTGLGLSISYGIIKEFGGDIKLVTEVDRGSTFFIILPAMEAQEDT
jgi:two-component system NtrC family sensor kinase